MAQLAPSSAARRRASAVSAHRETPNLSLVARTQNPRNTLPLILVSTLVLVGSLIATLLLSISMASTSYEITRTKMELNSLQVQHQSLQERARMLGTPQELERQARDLGMVPAGDIAYIDLASGKIIGKAGAATPADPAAFIPTTTAPASVRPAYDYGMGNERN